MLSMIAGMSNNRVIGHQNQLPWHLPEDMVWFKKNTMGKPIVMGRKTHESIGKPLPGRQNIILSRNPDFQLHDCEVVSSPQAAIALAEDAEEIMVIGGEMVYELFLPYAQRLYLTLVDAEVKGDAFFPDYYSVADWKEVYREDRAADERHAYAYSFQQLERLG